MWIGAFQPTAYRPPGGSVQPFSQELTETFFRAIAAQSTSAVIGPGFVSLELRATKAGKAQFVWHFNDGTSHGVHAFQILETNGEKLSGRPLK